MIKFVIVTKVQSRAFPAFVPALGNMSKAFDIVPVIAWKVTYRGAITIFHNEAEKNRYVAAKVSAGAILIH